jgi:hypothetical protein
MAFRDLAHDLLDPCREAQMPCNLPCKTADPSGARQPLTRDREPPNPSAQILTEGFQRETRQKLSALGIRIGLPATSRGLLRRDLRASQERARGFHALFDGLHKSSARKQCRRQTSPGEQVHRTYSLSRSSAAPNRCPVLMARRATGEACLLWDVSGAGMRARAGPRACAERRHAQNNQVSRRSQTDKRLGAVT